MASILICNISDEKLQKIKFVAFKLGIKLKEIAKDDFSKSVGYLAGIDEIAPGDRVSEPFSDEMLVLCDFDSAKLDALLLELRRSRAVVALKAVLTETNASWSLAELHGEIAREHEAMKAIRNKDAAEGSVHKQ